MLKHPALLSISVLALAGVAFGPDFKSLLSKPVESAERPKPLPAGTYHGIITGHKYDESREKKTPYVRFTFSVTGAGEDIDPADMEGIDLSKKQLRRDFYLTEDALFRLRDFIESCKIPTAGRSFNETIPEANGLPVIIEVTQRPGQTPEEIFNDVGKVVGA